MSHLFRNIVRFIRALRRLGVPVDPNQARALVAALETIGLERRGDVKAAARAVLITRREHLALFDRAFDLFWDEVLMGMGSTEGSTKTPDPGELVQPSLDRPGSVSAGSPESARPDAASEDGPEALLAESDSDAGAPDGTENADEEDADGDRPWMRVKYSAHERLRRKDFARLTDEERRRITALIALRPWKPPMRRARRRRPGGPHRRDLDLRRTWRRALRHGGEPISLAWHTRKVKPRPLVVLCDVSGSMEPYSRLLLKFAYALGADGTPFEVFAFGTRLTRITRALDARDADAALSRVSDLVRDFDGGTRIGDALRRFNVDWGRRVLRRGPIVLVISDGWDRGDVDLLEREVAQLHRSCYRLLWLNPLLGSPGYEPLTPGIRAVLRHVDEFLPAHDLASLEQLGALLEDLTRRTGRVKVEPAGDGRPPILDSPREKA